MAASVIHLRDTDVFSLSDDEFRNLVDKDIRRDHPDMSMEERGILARLSPQLRQQENLDRWHSILVEMKKSAETQLGARKADLKKFYGTIGKDKYETRLRGFLRWRAGTLRFLNGVEERLAECRRLRTYEFGGKLPGLLESLREQITQVAVTYEDQIIAHKRQTLADGLEPSPFDQHLWAVIDGRDTEVSANH